MLVVHLLEQAGGRVMDRRLETEMSKTPETTAWGLRTAQFGRQCRFFGGIDRLIFSFFFG